MRDSKYFDDLPPNQNLCETGNFYQDCKMMLARDVELRFLGEATICLGVFFRQMCGEFHLEDW